MNKINNEQDLLAFGCAVSSLKGIPGLSKFESPINLMSPVSDETEIGAYTYVGPAGEIGGAKIGRFCSIAPRVVIAPFEHPTDWLSSHPFQFGRSRKFKFWPEFSEFRFKQLPMKPPTSIGNDVWIGDGAVIMRGLEIGNGAIIAAGAVVAKDVPPYAIVGGVPAKVIKFRFDENTIARLEAVQWWRYKVWKNDANYQNVSDILEHIESGAAPLFRPDTWTVIRNSGDLFLAKELM